MVREARNDAVDTDAFASHLSTRLIDLILILEEAILSQMLKVEDLMVRNPVVAEPWQLLDSPCRLEALFALAEQTEARFHAAQSQVASSRPLSSPAPSGANLSPQDPTAEPVEKLPAKIRSAHKPGAIFSPTKEQPTNERKLR